MPSQFKAGVASYAIKLFRLLACLVLCIVSANLFAQATFNVSFSTVAPGDIDENSGEIVLDISGGVAPYSVNWCNGVTDSTILTNLAPGIYSVEVVDAAHNSIRLSVPISHPVVWDSLRPSLSTNRLPQNQDGWVEFTVVKDSMDLLFGMSYELAEDTYRLENTIVDVGFHLIDGRLLIAIDSSETDLSGTLKYQVGDNLKVERAGSVYTFYQNGLKIFRVESTRDLALNSPAARIGFNQLRIIEDILNQVTPIRHNYKSLFTQMYYSYGCNDNMNWIYTEVYDGNDFPVSATKQFYDDIGRPIQGQSMNIEANTILATETRYDDFGRAALSTLPAPIDNKTFCYKPHFVTTDVEVGIGGVTETVHEDYAPNFFDNVNSNPVFNTLENPLPVSHSSYGELGWYYGDNNPERIATDDFPYSRVEYYNEPTSAVKRSAAPGEKLRMGSGHEVRSFAMPSLGELYYVYGYKRNTAQIKYSPFKDTDLEPSGIFDATCQRFLNDKIQAYKSITLDQNGNESVTFTDIDGKTLATCLSGAKDGTNVHTQSVYVIVPAGEYRDIHIPAGCEGSVTVSSVAPNVFGEQLQSDEDCSGLTFSIYDLNKNNDPDDAHTQTLAYWLNDEQTFSPGYYRIANLDGSGDYPGCSLKISYNLNYYNFALYYYDEVGRLTAVVPPEGVEYYSPAVLTQTDEGCQSVTDITKTTVGSSYSYSPSFGFDDLPLGGANNSVKNYFNVYLSGDECSGGTSHSATYQSSYNNTLQSEPSPVIQAATIPAPPSFYPYQPQGLDTKVGDATAYVFTLNVKAVSGSDEQFINGNDNPRLIFIKKNYTANETTGDNSTPVLKDHWDEFYCAGCAGSSFLPSANENIQLSELLSCDHQEVDFEIVNVDKYTYNVVRTGPVPVVSGSSTTQYYLDGLRDETPLWSINPATETNLADINLVFNRLRKLSASDPALSLVESAQFNNTGEQIWSYSPDGSRTDYYYEDDGRIRYSQNEVQRAAYKFSYVNYDNALRPIEVGEYDAAIGGDNDAVTNINDHGAYFFPPRFGSFTAMAGASYLTYLMGTGLDANVDEDRCTQVTKYYYDEPDGNLSTLITGRTQRFVKGAISKIERYAGNTSSTPEHTVWYSYDELGRLEWEVQAVLGDYKTVDYAYDFNGNVTTVAYQKGNGNEAFQHSYRYNQNKQLTQVVTKDENNTIHLQARYSYFLHGPLKRAVIGSAGGGYAGLGLQGIDYTYTLNGALKAINHASLDENDPGHDGFTGGLPHQDLFGLELDYYNADYKHAGTAFNDGSYAGSTIAEQFNGNIRSVRWRTNGIDPLPYLDGLSAQNMFGITYDKATNWMKGARFGAYIPKDYLINDGGLTPTLANIGVEADEFSETNLSYDLNGNIKTLTRSGAFAQGIMDDLTYQYHTKFKNRLMYVANAATGTGSLLGTQSTGNYAYNDIGQMTQDVNDDQAVDYDAYGNIRAIWDATHTNKKVEYKYDALGYKREKISYGTSATTLTYYIRNSLGQIMRVVEFNQGTFGSHPAQRYETPLYGLTRLGMRYSPATYVSGAYQQGTASTEYELTDHLGNVRVTFNEAGDGSLNKTGYADYYPMGMKMPDRQLIGANNYRFGYQGQFAEKCDESGYNDFELRSYDARLGRWFDRDYYFQHYSPYLAMGNSWLNCLDPDGGFDDKDTPGAIAYYSTTTGESCVDQPGSQPTSGFMPVGYYDEGGHYVSSMVKDLADATITSNGGDGNFIQGSWLHMQWAKANNFGDKIYDNPIGWSVKFTAESYAGRSEVKATKILYQAVKGQIYKGIKNAVINGAEKAQFYVGKTVNTIKQRYNLDKIEAWKINTVIEGIQDNKLLRAIEQRVIERARQVYGQIANKRNAFDPKSKDYAEYMKKADEHLSQYGDWWGHLFGEK